MRIVPQSVATWHSQSPEIPLLAPPFIAGLLPAQTYSAGSGKPDPYEMRSEDKIDVAVNQFREAMIRCAEGKLDFMALVDLVSDLFMQVHPKGKNAYNPHANPAPMRFRSLEEMNQELIDKYGDTMSYLAGIARSFGKDRRHD